MSNGLPNLNSVLIVGTAVILLIVNVYYGWRSARDKVRKDRDEVRVTIIQDYKDRMDQLEEKVAELQKENIALTGKLAAVSELPLKRIDDSVAVLASSQAAISSTQSEIIRILTQKTVAA